jgi:high-affinity iron transporter
MLASLIVVFREALEAGLIVGIVLAASQGVRGRGRWLAGGIGAGLIGAALIAMFAGALSNAFEGTGQEIFTAGILCFAVVMLSWHIVWMAQHGRTMAAEMREIGREVKQGERSLLALAVVVGVAVLREGAEVVLFLYGIATASHESAFSLTTGGLIGLALAGACSWMLYRGLVAIPMRLLFSVTNTLIALLAAGMAGQAAAILHGADLLPGWGEQLWNTSFLIADDSLVGRSLHALVGYSARPCGVQAVAWAVTLGMLQLLSRTIGRPRPRAATAAVAVALLLMAAPQAHADDIPTLVMKNHRFVPDHIEVPAGVKFRLTVTNTDDTADEFESAELNREKLVAPGQSITVFLGPLQPGSYKFFGDFHQDTAQGVMVAK